jgi:hypothetical protein
MHISGVERWEEQAVPLSVYQSELALLSLEGESAWVGHFVGVESKEGDRLKIGKAAKLICGA